MPSLGAYFTTLQPSTLQQGGTYVLALTLILTGKEYYISSLVVTHICVT
jgi:hypothetical protein